LEVCCLTVTELPEDVVMSVIDWLIK
jgi:hypothetical protein